MRRFVMIVIAAVMVSVAASRADVGQDRIDSLRGAGKIAVTVAVIGDGAKAANVDTEQLKTWAEITLRKLGIPLQPIEKTKVGEAFLFVQVSINPAGTAGNLITIAIEYDQPVKIAAVERPIMAITWLSSTSATRSATNSKSEVKDAVTENLERFANNYLAANETKKDQ